VKIGKTTTFQSRKFLSVHFQPETSRVESFLTSNRFGSTNHFEGDIVAVDDQACESPKKAYCYLSSKQVSVQAWNFHRKNWRGKARTVCKGMLEWFDLGWLWPSKIFYFV